MSMDVEVFGMCAANCKFPVYTKEQVLSILQQMIDGGSLAGVDPSQSPIVALLREEHKNNTLSFWVGSEAEYNALDPAPAAALVMGRIGADGKLYFCTDDTTLQAWQQEVMLACQKQTSETTADIMGVAVNALEVAAEAQEFAAEAREFADSCRYLYGTEDLTNGVSDLESGKVYFVY